MTEDLLTMQRECVETGMMLKNLILYRMRCSGNNPIPRFHLILNLLFRTPIRIEVLSIEPK